MKLSELFDEITEVKRRHTFAKYKDDDDENKPTVRFVTSNRFKKLFAKNMKRDKKLKEKYYEFLKKKADDPHQDYGSNDKMFSSNNVFKKILGNIKKAHLLPDAAIVYSVHDNNKVHLYGIYSHDDLGLAPGRSAKNRKQDSVVSALTQMEFDADSAFTIDNIPDPEA